MNADTIIPLLTALEHELQQRQLWQDILPPDEALASSEPFCVDTLTFPQWLQFIFIPKMRYLVESSQPMPDTCAIAQMGTEYFKSEGDSVASLLVILSELDRVITQA